MSRVPPAKHKTNCKNIDSDDSNKIYLSPQYLSLASSPLFLCGGPPPARTYTACIIHSEPIMSCHVISLQAYDDDTGRFIAVKHKDDNDFQDAFWKKILHSLCDPGCGHVPLPLLLLLLLWCWSWVWMLLLLSLL